MTDNNQNEPSLIGGHAQYAKGTVESTIGNVTGSQPWKDSGEQDKAAGQATMARAGDQRDSNQGYGKVEEVAGNLTGCDGMKKEGAQSQDK
ncbi:hypothetical protein K4F52_006785 [Lecanicillium sp. MT-2017a]|nr:hypothetical protein K4F52_006785 [Lecanicillium sp. MT-2017a]